MSDGHNCLFKNKGEPWRVSNLSTFKNTIASWSSSSSTASQQRQKCWDSHHHQPGQVTLNLIVMFQYGRNYHPGNFHCNNFSLANITNSTHQRVSHSLNYAEKLSLSPKIATEVNGHCLTDVCAFITTFHSGCQLPVAIVAVTWQP